MPDSVARSVPGPKSAIALRSVDDQRSSNTSPSSDSTADPRSGVVQTSGGAQGRTNSSSGANSKADPRSGVVQISGGALVGSPPSRSDTDTGADAISTQSVVPVGAATAAPTEQPAAVSATEKLPVASPARQPTSVAPSTEQVASLIARVTAGPKTARDNSDIRRGFRRTASQRAGPDRRFRHR